MSVVPLAGSLCMQLRPAGVTSRLKNYKRGVWCVIAHDKDDNTTYFPSSPKLRRRFHTQQKS